VNYRRVSPIKRFLAFVLECIIYFAVIYTSISTMELMGEHSQFRPIITILGCIGAQIYFMTRSTTLGKYILDMKVINKTTLEDVTFITMLFRETIGKLISILFLGLGLIWIIIDNRHNAWHDIIFNTIVVEKKIVLKKK
jgi:uncharacterized RDD family membrane protein YckC